MHKEDDAGEIRDALFVWEVLRLELSRPGGFSGLNTQVFLHRLTFFFSCEKAQPVSRTIWKFALCKSSDADVKMSMRPFLAVGL